MNPILFLILNFKNMTLEENIFANPLSIEDLEAKLKASLADAFSFLIESCCIDTQPSIPS
jgi:hypothetical protein